MIYKRWELFKIISLNFKMTFWRASGFISRAAFRGGTGYNCPGRHFFGGAKILWPEICSLVNYLTFKIIIFFVFNNSIKLMLMYL
jgi:hypothetical protein